MKNFIITALLLCCFGAAVVSGPAKDKKAKRPAKKHHVAAKPTGRFHVDDNGHLCPVFKTASGRFYAYCTRKNGGKYKAFLISDKMTIDAEGN